MSWKVIPLSQWPDQDIAVAVEVSGRNIPLRLRLRWSFEYGLWHMDVSDGKTNAPLICGLTLVTGDYPSADILAQYQHLGLGSALLIPATNQVVRDLPDLDTMGMDFLLIWGDGEPS